MEDMLTKEEDPSANPDEPGASFHENDTLSQVVLARWQKRKSSMSRLASKVSRWAKSLKKYNCTTAAENDVRLDRHVHPPGHDNAAKVGRSIAAHRCFGL